MFIARRFLCASLVLALSPACTNSSSGDDDDNGGSSSGNVTSSLGAACAGNTDCSAGLVCQTSQPGGYCTRACLDDAECAGGACIAGGPVVAAICVKSCSAPGQCRDAEGYACSLVRDATLGCVPAGGSPSSSSSGASSSTGSSAAASSSGGTGSSGSTSSAASASAGSSSGGSASSSDASAGSSSGGTASSAQGTSSSAASSTGASTSTGSSASAAASSSGGASSTSTAGASSSAASSSSSGSAASTGSSSSGGMVDRTAACNAAQTLTPGTLVTGNTSTGTSVVQGCQLAWVVGDAAPENIWVLTVPQAGGLTVRVSSTWDASVYILGGPGSTCANAPLLRADACADAVVSNAEEVISLNQVEAGTYWVVVDGYRGGVGTPTSGSYTLRADLVPGGQCVVDPSITPPASNNTAGGAAFLSSTPSPEAVCTGDEDWYRFSVGGGDASVVLTPQGNTPGSLLVDFYTLTTAGTSVTAAPYTSGVMASGNTYRLVNPPAGAYGVRVRGTGLGQAGVSYVIALRDACFLDAQEPDDSLAAAPIVMNPLGGLASNAGQSSCPGNADVFLVPAPANGPATITVLGGAAVDLRVQGVTLGTNDAVVDNPAGVTQSTVGADRVVQWNALAGRVLAFTVTRPAGSTTGAAYAVRTEFAPANNDVCSSAVALTLPAVNEAIWVPFTTVGRADNLATVDIFCDLGSLVLSGPDVFFTFATAGTMPKLSFAILTANGSASVNHAVYMLAGGCSGTEVACQLNGFSTDPLTGAQYTLVLDGALTGGEMVLEVSRLP